MPLHNLANLQAKKKINELIEFLQIEYPDKKVGEYSAGMKQRLNITRALLHNPPIMLMDEPTKSLDPETAQKLRFFFKEELSKKQDKTILFATHNIEEANFLATRIGRMENGKIK